MRAENTEEGATCRCWSQEGDTGTAGRSVASWGWWRQLPEFPPSPCLLNFLPGLSIGQTELEVKWKGSVENGVCMGWSLTISSRRQVEMDLSKWLGQGGGGHRWREQTREGTLSRGVTCTEAQGLEGTLSSWERDRGQRASWNWEEAGWDRAGTTSHVKFWTLMEKQWDDQKKKGFKEVVIEGDFPGGSRG